jgi:SagB-type dehydrogenase family enzyme
VKDVLEGDQPPLFKRYAGAPRILLPRPAPRTLPSFGAVLRARRTTREFSEAPVALDVLSEILHAAFAPQEFIDAESFGMLPYRNYANAGARSENEVYLNVRAVDGVDAGLYHYNGIEHCLEHLGTPLDRERILYLTYQQPWCADAAVTFFVTAVVDRMGHKYHHPRALRAIYYDVGHLGQTFALVATAHGLGPLQTAALRDSEVEEALGVDGVRETVLYCLGAGVPAATQEDAGRPVTLAAMRRTRLFDDA